ncbi:phosphatase PAP2 family protein [Rhizobium setariae]|uniref:phosphatase PAP2 family protein n=1 Tax=Rhizobium setariae TaxID=2801340 RepID=UPI0031BB4156
MTPRKIWAATQEKITLLEPMVVVAFLAVSVSGFVFLRLASEISERETRAFDTAILRALREPQDLAVPIGPAWLMKAFTDLTSLGGVTVLSIITTLSVIFLFLVRRRITAIFLMLSVLGGWVLSNGLKLGFSRPRPEIVPHLVEVHDLSFPSGHAMLSAVAYLTLGLLLAQTQKSRVLRCYFVGIAIFLTVLVGVSRVYLGVHFPTDVLGGWCAGAAWACLCWLIARRLIPEVERAASQG